jgi:hypothetical protein
MDVIEGIYKMATAKDPKKDKERAEKLERKMIVLKQKQIEQFEVNQTWYFVFGTEKPKKKKDRLKIKNITYRNIWMDQNFLFNQIVEQNRAERFHSIETYALQWQPPDSVFRLLIPLDNRQIQADSLKKMQSLLPKQRKNIVFYFAPIRADVNLFAPKVHPSASESFHDRPSVLRKLCDKYMSSAVTLEDFSNILEAGYSTWQIALFNLLTEEEQQFHRYLLKPPPKAVKKSLERQYLDDEIDLQQYDDLKFPIRKAKKDEEMMDYPRPYTYGSCIVCKEENNALIKCLHCSNIVCIACIQRVFLDPATSEGSFLLLHRRYCTQFGSFPQIKIEVIPEPAFLRELRRTGKLASNDHMRSVAQARITVEEDEHSLGWQPSQTDDASSEEDSLDGDENKVDDMPKILHLTRALDNCTHKIQHSLPLLMEYQEVIDNPRRSSHLRERMQRMKDERVERLAKVQEKIPVVKNALSKYMKVDVVIESIKLVNIEEGKLRRFLEAESLEAYTVGEEKLKEVAELQRQAEEAEMLLKFSKM